MKEALEKKTIHIKWWVFVSILVTLLPVASLLVVDTMTADMMIDNTKEYLRVKGQFCWYIFIATLINLAILIAAVIKMKGYRVIPVVCIAINLIVMYMALYTYALFIR